MEFGLYRAASASGGAVAEGEPVRISLRYLARKPRIIVLQCMETVYDNLAVLTGYNIVGSQDELRAVTIVTSDQ